MLVSIRKVRTLVMLGSVLLMQTWACGGGLPGTSPALPVPPSVPQCEESETERLAEGVYSFRRGLYSTLFLVGQGGVIVIDPLAEEASCLERALQDKAPGLSVQHLLYSHAGADHIAGARRLPLSPGVRVYAHRQAAQELSRSPRADILPVTDVLDINRDGAGQALQLNLLGRRLSLSYFGPTAGDGNLLIHLPDAGVAMFVDVLLADTVPGLILAGMSPQGVLRTLSELVRLNVTRVVVGHGRTATDRDVRRTLAYWQTYISEAQGALKRSPISIPDLDALEGAPLLKILPQLPVKEVLAALLPYYGEYLGFQEWGPNGFDFAYVYLTGESPMAVSLRPAGPRALPRRWEKVGEGAYYAQVGARGSLIFDPDPDAREALLVVDPLGEDAAVLRDLLRMNIPGRRVGHVVYTHAHNDRVANAAELCGGNLSGVRIYAHENAARDLRERKNPSVATPTDVIGGEGTDLKLAGKTVSLRWYGPGHGDGNLVVHLPEAKVAMGVGMVQDGALPGLMAVETDPAGLYRTLSAMEALPAEVYLTGEGGWMDRRDFTQMVMAVRDLYVSAALAMKTDLPAPPVPLSLPVAPTLRSVVDAVGGKVIKSLTSAYPTLKSLSQGPPGELGFSYCISQSAIGSGCEVR